VDGAERLAGMGFRVYEGDEVELGVRRADPRRVLGRYLAASEDFTNLLCVETAPDAPV
jgi:hypothetical protein